MIVPPESPKKTRDELLKVYRRRCPKHLKLHKNDFQKVTTAIFSELAKEIVNHPAGVHMNNLGYFFVFIPEIFESNKIAWKYKNIHPLFIPTQNSPFKYYQMDWCFYNPIKKAIFNKVKEGHYYLNMYKGLDNGEGWIIGSRVKSRRYYKLRKSLGHVV